MIVFKNVQYLIFLLPNSEIIMYCNCINNINLRLLMHIDQINYTLNLLNF